jgi:CRP/FNR family transcriptional regulator, dissimilatory nitrate respiration regulator
MTDERVLRELGGTTLLAELAPDALARLAGIAVRVKLGGGASVFNQGDAADAFFLLVHGEVKVFKVLRDGRTATLRHVQPGETFGESVFSAPRFPAYTETTAPSVMYRVPIAAFRQLLLGDPELAVAMLGRMAHLMVLLNRRVEELLLPVPARLARYLLELSNEQLDPPPPGPSTGSTDDPPSQRYPRICLLPMSKRELAARLGTVPETLSRAFTALKRARVIRSESGGELVAILDFDALARIAQY